MSSVSIPTAAAQKSATPNFVVAEGEIAMVSRLVLAAAIAGVIAAPAAAQQAGVMKKALSDLVNGQKTFAGHVDITEAPGGVLLRVEVQGLTPGWHGMHLHEKADCSAADFTSAGGHINHAAAKKAHGLLNPQGPDFGDLPNLYVDADGRGRTEAYTTLVKFSELTDTDGSALIIHANADDHTSQPIGGAGGRVACGVIR
jgi:Cu-Zn family superoxide dismutase